MQGGGRHGKNVTEKCAKVVKAEICVATCHDI